MQQWPQDWKRSVFVPMLPAWPCARHLVNTKEAVVRSHPTQRPSSRPAGRARGCGCACFLSWPQEINFLDFIKKKKKECSNCTVALISHASKVMLNILQARPQQYVNCELQDVQTGFRKDRGTRGQIANIRWIIKKAKEFQKNIYFCFTDYAKAFDCLDHHKLWNILQAIGIPDHLTWLLRNLYAGQEATVRTEPGATDWYQIGKGVCQSCILSPWLFNLYSEYIIRNTGLEEAQAGIMRYIARREISVTSDMQMTPPLWQKVKKT